MKTESLTINLNSKDVGILDRVLSILEGKTQMPEKLHPEMQAFLEGLRNIIGKSS